jgi:hypothetical protein
MYDSLLPDLSVSSPRILELRTFHMPILLKVVQLYKVGTEQRTRFVQNIQRNL